MVIKDILFPSFFENSHVKNVSQLWLLFNSLQLFDFSFMLTFKVEKGEVHYKLWSCFFLQKITPKMLLEFFS